MVVIGLIGKPNVGKSTFFRAVTLLPVKIADYPFTTLEPHKGEGFLVIECVENEFRVKCNPRNGICRRGFRYIPIELVDVPGLVKEAYKGRGLGNKFLDAIRQADILINIVDIAGSTDDEGNPVEPGSYNPLEDFVWVEEEIDQWFYQKIKANIEKIKKKIKEEPGKTFDHLYKVLSGIGIKRDHIISTLRKVGTSVHEIMESEEALFKFSKALRQISKPIIHSANKIDLYTGKKYFEKVTKRYPDKIIIATSAYAELGLRILDNEGKIEYIPGTDDIRILSNEPHVRNFVEYVKENVLGYQYSTGVQEVLNMAIFNVLGYVAVWPVANEDLTDSYGRVLPDVYLMPPGSSVLDLAAKIHTDLAKKFIKAKELKTGQIVDRDYKLKHNDVIQIITGK
ncbi:MAG TPA: redox-regulated ATPase YchF [Candidatus Nanopusillus sp.]|nr:redox-regulated ATPase YchF [Candidatus Nanopusillus sp.]HIP89933.1 redox-regulated ATPase YchF [Candidatus Nanopusillus sp.]